jgi:L-ascorbate 6-phosphate lactonase
MWRQNKFTLPVVLMVSHQDVQDETQILTEQQEIFLVAPMAGGSTEEDEAKLNNGSKGMSRLAEVIKTTLVEPGKLAVFWLGGAAFAFKTASGKIVYIDPYLSDSLDHFYSWKRLPGSPILIQPSEVEADLVLITHAHEDHLDPHTLPHIAEHSQAVFAGPTSCIEAMRSWGFSPERLVEINNGEVQVICGLRVAAVYAHHPSNAGAQTPDAVGYIVDLDGITIYHTGDTLYDMKLSEAAQFHPDLLLVCINGAYGNMPPDDAAILTSEIHPAVVIPMHWGLVAENTSNPAEFMSSLCKTRARLER